MIKNNFFGTVLIVFIAVFLLIAGVQFIGLGSEIKEIQRPEDINDNLPKVKSSNGNHKNQSLTEESLNNIKSQPLFSLNRQPYAEKPVELVEVVDEVKIEELNAKVTSVVITPDNKYAMIQDGLNNEKSFFKEGMPLDGEQGGWTVFEIQPRKVVFKSEDDRTHVLELEVFAPKGNARKASKPNQKGNNKNNKKEEDKNESNKRTAEEIRKKIAERRAQMRSEALNQKQ